jgi:hypothetical protein
LQRFTSSRAFKSKGSFPAKDDQDDIGGEVMDYWDKPATRGYVVKLLCWVFIAHAALNGPIAPAYIKSLMGVE